jgi:hypothetical protein
MARVVTIVVDLAEVTVLKQPPSHKTTKPQNYPAAHARSCEPQFSFLDRLSRSSVSSIGWASDQECDAKKRGLWSLCRHVPAECDSSADFGSRATEPKPAARSHTFPSQAFGTVGPCHRMFQECLADLPRDSTICQTTLVASAYI